MRVLRCIGRELRWHVKELVIGSGALIFAGLLAQLF